MSQFIFAYHGGKRPETPEEGEKVMAQWNAWFGTMGDDLIVPGAPLGMSKTVDDSSITDDGGANPLSGYSVVAAESIEVACEMAKGCPMVQDHSGSVEVAEILEM